jgi:hypothetical protein
MTAEQCEITLEGNVLTLLADSDSTFTSNPALFSKPTPTLTESMNAESVLQLALTHL